MTEPVKTRDAYYILIILALITGTFWYGKNEGKKAERLKQENQFLMERIKELESERDTATARATQESDKRAKVIQTANKEQRDLKASVEFWKQRVQSVDKIARVQPTPIGSSDSTMIYPCAERDSVIDIQDRLVMSLDTELTQVSDSFTRELKFKDDQLGAQRAISELWEKSAVSSNKQVKREKFWKRTWRSIAVGAGVAVGVLILAQ